MSSTPPRSRATSSSAAPRQGEEILALDGETYRLDATMCVIADDNGVESIAGIMGGEHSGCDAATTDVLIESALWEPLNIARTGRSLGINTDARYRFERGVDPAFTVPGADLATALVLEICGGTAEHADARRRHSRRAPGRSPFRSRRCAGSPASRSRTRASARSCRVSASRVAGPRRSCR